MKRSEQIIIPYSEAMVKKIGVANLAKERNRNFLGHIFFYAIDHRYRKVVHLSKWFREQLRLAELDVKMQAEVKKLKSASTSNDDLMRRILLFTQKVVFYTADPLSKISTPEYWQTASETFIWGMGDCEDGAIFMATMALMAGIDPNQIMLNAGPVYDESSRMNKLAEELGQVKNLDSIGHCWLEYLSEYDGVPRIMDWCYWSNRKLVKNRPYYTQEPKYFDTWFSFNSLRYYGRFRNE